MDGWMELWNQHSQESSAVSDADLALAVTLTDFSDTPVSEVRHRANQVSGDVAPCSSQIN